jgi:hypothetical protein
MARLLFELVGLSLRFIGLGSLFCHVDYQICGLLMAPRHRYQPRF